MSLGSGELQGGGILSLLSLAARSEIQVEQENKTIQAYESPHLCDRP